MTSCAKTRQFDFSMALCSLLKNSKCNITHKLSLLSTLRKQNIENLLFLKLYEVSNLESLIKTKSKPLLVFILCSKVLETIFKHWLGFNNRPSTSHRWKPKRWPKIFRFLLDFKTLDQPLNQTIMLISFTCCCNNILLSTENVLRSFVDFLGKLYKTALTINNWQQSQY